jgi:ABC-type branched-subunit amino acid transport system permease subunit
MVVAVSWFLHRTRAGLILRAVGENDLSAHSIGYSVIGVRYAALAFGGAMAGIAGAYFSLVITPMWAERMTAGRGWIALAVVVFAGWKAGRLLIGAYLSILLLLMGFVYGPLGAWAPGLFPARVRYTGASVAFNVGGVIGGGFTPVVAEALRTAPGLGLPYVGYYLSAAAALSLLALLFLRRPAVADAMQPAP